MLRVLLIVGLALIVAGVLMIPSPGPGYQALGMIRLVRGNCAGPAFPHPTEGQAVVQELACRDKARWIRRRCKGTWRIVLSSVRTSPP